jgi:chorismate mutase
LFANKEHQEECKEEEGGSPSYVSHSVSPPMTTCVTPAHDNLVTDEVLMVYTNDLEERNAWLNERFIELDRTCVNLISEVETLTAVIAQLKSKLKATGYNEDDEGQCHENLTKRKYLVEEENAKLSHELLILINSFVTHYDLSDRQKFPTR